MKKPSKCVTPHCQNLHAKGRRVCYRCFRRAERARKPVWAQWRRLKDKARQRGINFCLPYWYFEIFALRSRYCDLTGNQVGCLTVDRVNNFLGYVMGNIRPLTREENRLKQWQQDYKRNEIGYSWRSRY